jgi:hypothetical protein
MRSQGFSRDCEAAVVGNDLMREIVIDTEITRLTHGRSSRTRADHHDYVAGDGRMIGGRARDWESHAPLQGLAAGARGKARPQGSSRKKPRKDRSYLHVRSFAP